MRIGIDVAVVDEIALQLDRYGSRYTRFLYSADEISASEAAGDTPGWLAGAFAVKEAVIKVLEPPDDHVPIWRSIELSLSRGHPAVNLTGPARARSRHLRLTRWNVSVGRCGPVVMAVVMASPS